jgi:hypothetical protein
MTSTARRPGPADRLNASRSIQRRTRQRLFPGKTLAVSKQALRARRKFLKIFPNGFRDEDYIELERAYKWKAHQNWEASLSKAKFSDLLAAERYVEIAATAVRIESRTNLLFSFEKMALRDAVKTRPAAKIFATALYELLYGAQTLEARFDAWIDALDRLPRRQTRVLTWPLATVFGFIARPDEHFFLKPTVTREAARRYGIDLTYKSRPSWPVYEGLLDFVARVRTDIRDLKPRDMIDLQSFLWIQGSDEYPG